MRMPAGYLAIAAALLAGPSAALAQTAEGQRPYVLIEPGEITWQSAPPGLPQGVQAARLYGDPDSQGHFALRLRLPAGTTLAAHAHTQPVVVTVISGAPELVIGAKLERDKATKLRAGSFFALPPRMAHALVAPEETVLQVNSIGPWAMAYLDPQDDPRGAARTGGTGSGQSGGGGGAPRQ